MSFVKTLGGLVITLAPFWTTSCAPDKKQEACLEERLDTVTVMLSAQQALEQGDADQARQLLEDIKERAQDAKHYHVLRGQVYAALAERVKIPMVFDNRMPQEEIIRVTRNARQEKYDLFDEAIRSYKRAILINEDVTSVQGLAIAYWQRGRSLAIPADIAAAADGFMRVLELNPEKTDTRVALGGVYAWMAMTSADPQEQERLYVHAYAQFVCARENHKKHPLRDERMLEYVNESIKAFEKRLPEEKRFH